MDIFRAMMNSPQFNPQNFNPNMINNPNGFNNDRLRELLYHCTYSDE